MSWLSSPLRSRRSAALLTAVVAAIVYANSLGNGFAFDDNPAIVNNEAVHDLSRLPETVSRPYWNNESGRELGIWRPVTTALFMVEWALWGDNPTPYHAVNVLTHAAATGVGTVLLAELIPLGAAFLGGLLFAVHPVHVEAVANVVGIAELLAGLLLFGACLLYLRRAKTGLKAGTIAVLTGLYSVAFLTKEHAAVLPALFVLLDAWRERLTLADLPAYLKRRGALFASMAVAALTILWLRVQVLGSIASPYPPLGADLLQEIPRIWTLPLIWTHYVRLLFFPADLIPDYSPSVIDIQIGWNAMNGVGVVLALAFLAVAWRTWRDAGRAGPDLRERFRAAEVEDESDAAGRPAPAGAVALGVLWFGVAVLPVANVFFLSGVLLAERTLYVPSLGFALAAGAVLWLLRSRWSRSVAVATALAVLLMAGRTWTANPAWSDSLTLFNRLVEKHPESGRGQWMLASHFWEDRDNPDRALDLYRLAVGINGPSYPMMVEIIGNLMEIGAYEQAETLARRIWREYPTLSRAPRLLALALSRQGRYADLVEPGRRALELEPDDAVLHHLVAVGHRERGEWEEALHHRKAAIANGEAGRWQQWRWLARIQHHLGDTVGAASSLDSARARATGADARSLLDSLQTAWTGRSEGGGQGDEDGASLRPDRVPQDPNGL